MFQSLGPATSANAGLIYGEIMAIFTIFGKLHEFDHKSGRFLDRNRVFFVVSTILRVCFHLYLTKNTKFSRFKYSISNNKSRRLKQR